MPEDLESLVKTEWTNQDNAAFYEGISIEQLKAFAKASGLDSGCDIDLLWPYIKDAKSILEIGAGYGRVVEQLLKRGFKGKITAVERSRQFYHELLSKFGKKVTLCHRDIRNFQAQERHDIILWLWSGISDFNKTEQKQIIKKLSCCLNHSGLFIIDTLLHFQMPGNSPNANALSTNQQYIIPSNDAIVQGYMPSPEELDDYQTSVQLNRYKYWIYFTSTIRKRKLFIYK